MPLLRVIAAAAILVVFLATGLATFSRAIDGYMWLRERLGDVTKNSRARRRTASVAANLICVVGAACGLSLLVLTLSMTRYIG